MLDNLPADGNCPECGQPIAASTVADGRVPTAWEIERTFAGFLRTSAAILLWPSYFFRHTTTRSPLMPALRFAQTYWGICAVLFVLAAWFHQRYYARMFIDWPFTSAWWLGPMVVVAFFGMWGLIYVAARLTVWEGRYRGYRLPTVAVRRGLYYHAAHAFPVAVMAALTTGGHLWLVTHQRHPPASLAENYLWVLSGEVIVAAAYLFWTYWAAMRNMMYANH